MVDLSIIIVSYNVKKLLIHCLESIQHQDLALNVEIIIVDNNSSDQTAQNIKRLYPDIHLIRNDKNIGFAAANNQGIRASSGRFIWLLNPDTQLLDHAIHPLINVLSNHPDAAVAGSLLRNPDGSLQPSCYPFPTLLRESLRLFHLDHIFATAYQMDDWDQNEIHPVDVNQGASFMIRRSALEEVGLLDEQFYMYTEEVDLCYRLKQKDWKIYWQPASEVIHYGGQSTRQNRTPMFLQLYQTKIQFFRKHYGTTSTFLYKLLLWIISMTRILGGYFLPKTKKDPYLYENYRQLLKTLSAY